MRNLMKFHDFGDKARYSYLPAYRVQKKGYLILRLTSFGHTLGKNVTFSDVSVEKKFSRSNENIYCNYGGQYRARSRTAVCQKIFIVRSCKLDSFKSPFYGLYRLVFAFENEICFENVVVIFVRKVASLVRTRRIFVIPFRGKHSVCGDFYTALRIK